MDEPTFGWTEFEEIALGLVEAHPDRDPAGVSFPELRELVEGLPGFSADEDHRVNEQILEAIQSAWLEELADGGDEDRGYHPNNPFR
ncbi:Fe-S cluster assembly protein IscX [Mucisphaera calidilacus]|uniref:FeS assembly protein IscX n=1 Tax=Mucisphaera calidilacus TaxID=2527982 RepID=A0A518BTK3_9BACT|nr:Fe-S cluster assembly protein IscX [Mucisphaera calidilacus]QDU70303.1 hypothetical protein Pan265_01260 [Mucisphaera calidilacus]